MPIRRVLIRDPRALPCTDLTADPARTLAWFVLRWRPGVTVEEARRHRGVEGQRQWSGRAIPRPTPTRFGLFSRVALYAHPRMGPTADRVRQAAWYHKPRPTCSDALALVRREIRGQVAFCRSEREADLVKVPRALLERLADTLCYAA